MESTSSYSKKLWKSIRKIKNQKRNIKLAKNTNKQSIKSTHGRDNRIQTYLRDIVGFKSIPLKTSIAIKQVIVFLLVEGLAVNL